MELRDGNYELFKGLIVTILGKDGLIIKKR
jgi:hypothetical protein